MPSTTGARLVGAELGHCHKWRWRWRWRWGDAVVDWHKAKDGTAFAALLCPALLLLLLPLLLLVLHAHIISLFYFRSSLSISLTSWQLLSVVQKWIRMCITDNDQVPSISNRTSWHWDSCPNYVNKYTFVFSFRLQLSRTCRYPVFLLSFLITVNSLNFLSIIVVGTTRAF